MDLIQAIKTRRSVRKFSDKPVDENIIKTMLEAAMFAPSAGNQQPWEFIVLNQREVLDSLVEFHPYAAMAKQAPLGVAICGNLNHEKHEGMWMLDCSAAAQNMLLAAHGLGLGGVWVSIYPRKERMEGLAKLLKLPEKIVPFCVNVFGYPSEPLKDAERFDESRVHYNSW